MTFQCKLFDLFEKRFATKRLTGLSFFFAQDFLDFAFGSDSGMIGTGEPEGTVTTHPFKSDDGVFDGEHRGVADMKRSGNVWRGQDNRKCRGIFWGDSGLNTSFRAS